MMTIKPLIAICLVNVSTDHSSLCPTKFPDPVISASTSRNGSKTETKTNLFVKNKGTYITTSAVQIRNKENGLIMSVRIIVDLGCPSSLHNYIEFYIVV